jgi:hypothetical protein
MLSEPPVHDHVLSVSNAKTDSIVSRQAGSVSERI